MHSYLSRLHPSSSLLTFFWSVCPGFAIRELISLKLQLATSTQLSEAVSKLEGLRQ